VDYKSTRLKQYHKEGRALRTETTINNTCDFGIGKSLQNLPALRQSAFKPTGVYWTSEESRSPLANHTRWAPHRPLLLQNLRTPAAP
jgi:hypothetical protein